MQTPRRLAGLIATAAALLVVCTGCGKDQVATGISDFSFDRVRTASDDLAVEVDQISGTAHEDFIEWACLISCDEPGGCHADLRITVDYQSAGVDREIVLTGTVDVPVGARARLSRIQRPPVPVDHVVRADVVVVADRGAAGGPPPTPRM